VCGVNQAVAPVVDLAQARSRYVTADEASVMLDGLISARLLRRWAREGRIVGAVRIGPKQVRFDRRFIPSLIRDLSAQPGEAPPGEAPPEQREVQRPFRYHDRRGHTTFDAPLSR
jgi:hypothetical protein